MTAFQSEKRPDADEQLSNIVSNESSSSPSSPANQMDLYDQLRTSPKHFADCCVGLSQPLLATLASRLPPTPALILSIGSGSGLLEAMLLKHSEKSLDLFGVEVSSCVNKHLPPDRLVQVPSTTSLHPDAMLASSLLFVYPRMPALITAYLDASTGGALEQVVWLGHRSDWPDFESVMRSRSSSVDVIEGSGLSASELLVVATM